jgi:alkylation response protein AidB-like acyl-CoA dehydrogenase
MKRDLYDADHEAFRATCRGFYDRHVIPFHKQWEADGIVDRGIWLEAGKQGLLGMEVPEEYGGGGVHDFRYNAVVVEENVRARASGVGFGLHNDVVAPYLLKLTTEEQKQRWLPKFCTGETITAIAMSEPGAGSDLQGITTTAVRDGDDYIVNGQKTFITNGIHSDLVIVVVKTDPEAKAAYGLSSSAGCPASNAAATSTRSG